MAGRGEQLKEFVIGVEVFGKGPSFDPRNDPIVRVQARRLRAQLARYYHEEGQADETLIELPKGGYTPVFKAFRGSLTKKTHQSPVGAGQPEHDSADPVCGSQRLPAISGTFAMESARKLSTP